MRNGSRLVSLITLLSCLPVQVMFCEVGWAQVGSDRKIEVDNLNKLAIQQYRTGKLIDSLGTFQRVLEIRQELKDRSGEGKTLNVIGLIYANLGQYPKALDYYQQALAIRKEVGDRAGEGTTLNNIGGIYDSLGQYAKSLEYYQQALAIRKEVGDRAGEGTTLSNMGVVYDNLGRYPQALDSYEQALTIKKVIADRAGEGTTLNNIGSAYSNLGKYAKALEYLQSALKIRKEVGDHAGEESTLNNIGLVYSNLGQYTKALENYLQALQISKEISDRSGEGTNLSNIGLVYDSLGQYAKALEYYQRALSIKQEIRDRAGEGITINNIGSVYISLGQYAKALEYYQQSLKISQEISDRSKEGITINNIGLVYSSLGQYAKALEYYQQAIAIRKEIGDRSGEGTTLTNIGAVYSNLGQYSKALEYLQNALKIRKEIGDRYGEGVILNNIGLVNDNLRQYDKALKYYQQALAIRKEVGDRSGEGQTINNIGVIFRNFGKYTQALEYYLQALKISIEVGDRSSEGATLNNIGDVYRNLGQYPNALKYYQKAIEIAKEIGDRATEGITLNNIGYILNAQSQTQIAILFFKESVKVRELIRKDLKKLTQEEQQSFTSTVADTYRTLADILLKQGRVTEALQVLDLLKIQELEDYLKNIKGNGRIAQDIGLLEPEKMISAQLLALNLDKIPELNRQLASQLKQLPKSEINKVPTYLQNIPQRAVLIYPLILSDRLELIVFFNGTFPTNYTIPIKKEALETILLELRVGLRDYTSDDVKESSKKLYDLLIKPIESELKQANADTILYAPDGLLRYIPLAALYDGKQYLVENYRINNLIAYSLFDSDYKSLTNPRIFAGAFGGKKGEKRFGQNSLPASIPEVEHITATFPNTNKYIEQNFTAKTAKEKVAGSSIVHFATHAEFSAGSPLDSYVLFGDGSKIPLAEINDLPLQDTALVVLSACQTGLGSTLGTGTEILGFGYQVQRAGAKASIASLWSVSDGGTQILMQDFYQNLQKGNIATSTALREAQLSMIRKPIKAGEVNYNHPFFWSAFVIIGNGL